MTGWIKRTVQLTAAACAAGSIAAAAQSPATETAGALLYTTHCAGCHTAQVHWRDARLVTDWASLAAQVRRWQVAAGLRWTDEDVAAVVRHLNAAYYHYPAPEARADVPARAVRAAAASR